MTVQPDRILVLTIAVDKTDGKMVPVGNLTGPGDTIRMLDAMETVAASMRRQLHIMFAYAADIEPSPDPNDPDDANNE